jgi:8-oxo-dGTP pyrophosphatase MutT (NUDIX family)
MKTIPQLPWECTQSEPGPTIPLFRVRYDWMRNPRNGASLKALILEGGDWVNIAAITPSEQIVIVRQFRFGVGKTTTEIPAGLVEPGESPLAAAQRELREETGYTSNEWVSLGSVDANSAFLNNQCHLWLARNARPTSSTALDASEDIQVDLLSLAELKTEIRAGRVSNSLSLLTLHKVFNLQEKDEK